MPYQCCKQHWMGSKIMRNYFFVLVTTLVLTGVLGVVAFADDGVSTDSGSGNLIWTSPDARSYSGVIVPEGDLITEEDAFNYFDTDG
jgi:hypothetical protein